MPRRESRSPRHLKNRDPRALQLLRFYKAHELYDPVADGLRRAFEYEKTFFDKISVAVQPLLESCWPAGSGSWSIPTMPTWTIPGRSWTGPVSSASGRWCIAASTRSPIPKWPPPWPRGCWRIGWATPANSTSTA